MFSEIIKIFSSKVFIFFALFTLVAVAYSGVCFNLFKNRVELIEEPKVEEILPT